MPLLKPGQQGAVAEDHVQMESGLEVPLSARRTCRAGKEKGCEGKGSARGELGGDNAEESALVGVSQCPDGCSSVPPVPQECVLLVTREAAACLEGVQRVEGRRRPILTGSGKGVPVPGVCSPAATGSAMAGEDISFGLGHLPGWGWASGDPPGSWLWLCCRGDPDVGLQAQAPGLGEGGGMSDPRLCVWERCV